MRYGLVWIICLVFGSGAFAADIDTRLDALRAHIYAGEDEAARRAVEAAQQAYLEGALTADEIRTLFIGLSRSHPKTVTFVKTWAEAEPANPQALIARTWSLWNAAMRMRQARNKVSEEAASAMRAQASELATKAYQIDPDLIPASDAIVRGLGWGETTAQDALDHVMTTRPNWGSLERGFYLTRSFEPWLLKAFCAHYAGAIPTDGPDIVRRCRFHGGVFSNMWGHQTYLDRHMWDWADPLMHDTQVRYILRRHRDTRLPLDKIQRLEEALLNPSEIDLYSLKNAARLVERYDGYLALTHQRNGLSATFARQHIALTEDYLAHDPYNPELIDLASNVRHSGQLLRVGQSGTRIHYQMVYPDKTPEEKAARQKAAEDEAVDMVRRRLRGAPYSPAAWSSHAGVVQSIPARYHEAVPALGNMVHFDDDRYGALTYYLFSVARHVDMMQIFEDDPEAAGPEWQEALGTYDVAGALLCPALKAYRMREGLCLTDEAAAKRCRHEDATLLQAIETLRQLALDAPSCAPMSRIPLDELHFEFTPMDLSGPEDAM